MQVLDSGITHVGKGADEFSRMVSYAEGQRMAITVESSTIESAFRPANHDGTSIHVGIEHSVHIILALGSLHQIPKCSPIC